MGSFNILEFLKEHFKDVIYISGAIATFFIGAKVRKINVQKEEVAVQAGELDNVETALKIYRLMLTDLQEKLKIAEEAYIVIEKRLHESIEARKALFDENQKLKTELNEIRSNNKQI